MGKRSKQEAEKLAIKAFQLLDNGFNQTEIADMLGVNVRTIQRWVAARPSLECNQKVESIPNAQVVKEAEQIDNCDKVPIQERLTGKHYLKGVLDVTEQAQMWGNVVSKNLQHHYVVHSEIAESLHLKLLEELQKPDASYRTINFLSLAFCRHCDYVHKNLFIGREGIMDVNRAKLVLGYYGYAVVDMKAVNEVLESE
jgi:Homeodomain-like domain